MLQQEHFERLIAMNEFFLSIEIPEDPDFPSVVNDKVEL